MNPSKPANLPEVERLMAGWTLLQKIRLAAALAGDVYARSVVASPEWEALGFILTEDFDKAVKLCDGDLEPPDDPEAWSGGFAENH